ncbi:MAG: hypothetical protein ACRERS_10085, partial [Methylococcales bacterium]
MKAKALHFLDQPVRNQSNINLRILWPFLRPYNVRLACAFVALVLAAAATLAMPIAVRVLVDQGFLASNPDSVNRYFIVLLVLVLS